MENPWEGILSAVIIAIQSTVHTMLGATTMQLMFGQDAILNISHEVNWNLIKKRKQELTCKNNTRKIKLVAHTYKSEDLILVTNEQKNSKDVYQALWTIEQVDNNRTVNIKSDCQQHDQY